MFRKNSNNAGYLLWEGSVALFLMTVIFFQLLPLMLFLEQQKQQRRQELEVYRYFSEIAMGYNLKGTLIASEKESNGIKMKAQIRETNGQLTLIKIETGGETVAISKKE